MEGTKNTNPSVKILFVMIDGLGDLSHKDIECNFKHL